MYNNLNVIAATLIKRTQVMMGGCVEGLDVTPPCRGGKSFG
jgi:hypothetical protein